MIINLIVTEHLVCVFYLRRPQNLNACIVFQGYYRKGAALFGLRRHEESVLAYLQCLALDPGVTLARKALAKV